MSVGASVGASVAKGAASLAGGADWLLKQGGRGVGRSPSLQGSQANAQAAARVAGAPQVGRSMGASASQTAARRLASRMPNKGRSSGAKAASRSGAANMGHVSGANASALQQRVSTPGRWRATAREAIPGKPRRSTIGIGAGAGGFGIGAVMGNAMFTDGSRPGPAARSAPSISRSGGSPTAGR